MTATDASFAYSRIAQLQRTRKAQELARWCYTRGIGPAVAQQDPALQRVLARRVGVPPPHLQPGGSSATWQQVAQLLTARATWDRNHGYSPPEHVGCIGCAVLEQTCSRCTTVIPPARRPSEPSVCLGCGLPLHQVFVDEGSDVHPTCARPAVIPAPAG